MSGRSRDAMVLGGSAAGWIVLVLEIVRAVLGVLRRFSDAA